MVRPTTNTNLVTRRHYTNPIPNLHHAIPMDYGAGHVYQLYVLHGYVLLLIVYQYGQLVMFWYQRVSKRFVFYLQFGHSYVRYLFVL
jgi:hypothetical protein